MIDSFEAITVFIQDTDLFGIKYKQVTVMKSYGIGRPCKEIRELIEAEPPKTYDNPTGSFEVEKDLRVEIMKGKIEAYERQNKKVCYY